MEEGDHFQLLERHPHGIYSKLHHQQLIEYEASVKSVKYKPHSAGFLLSERSLGN